MMSKYGIIMQDPDTSKCKKIDFWKYFDFNSGYNILISKWKPYKYSDIVFFF